MMLFFCCWKRYYWCGSCGCCCSVAVRGIDVDVAVADILVVVASKPRVWGGGGVLLRFQWPTFHGLTVWCGWMSCITYPGTPSVLVLE